MSANRRLQRAQKPKTFIPRSERPFLTGDKIRRLVSTNPTHTPLGTPSVGIKKIRETD